MFDSRLTGGALDYAGFHTARLDSLYAAIARATTESAVAGTWAAVQRELHSTMPVTWIYHARGVQGVSRRLAGVRMDPRGEMATLASWRLLPDASGTP
jgi:peptide/nickel transport system substrate-binding protein